MGKYKSIFFDLDNTLLDFYASEKKAIKEVLAMHGLPSDDNTAKTYSKINKSYWEAFERGDIKREEIFEGRFNTLLEKLKLEGDAAKISKDYFFCLANGHDLMEGAIEILEYLKQKGYLIYATTNGVATTQFKRIRQAGIEQYFDDVFISEHVGSQKPERRYFEYVLEHIPPTNKEEILIIGDSQSSDILGGLNIGIDTCWFAKEDAKGEYTPNFRVSRLLELKNIL